MEKRRESFGLEDSELTGRIIGAAISVHRALGPGFVEAVYEEALVLELQARGIAFERQVMIPITYRGAEVGTHRLDLLVERVLIVELKAVRELGEAHITVVRSYCRAAHRPYALLLNFAGQCLEKHRIYATSTN